MYFNERIGGVSLNIKNLFHRKKIYKMDMASANDTLQNVFAACEKEPNTIPFDKIVLRRKADTRLTCICKFTTLIMILALIFIPLFTLRTSTNIETEYNKSSLHIVDHFVTEKFIHLTFEEANYYAPSCYSLDTNGQRSLALIDHTNPTHLVFAYTGVTIHLYLCDEYGEYLHLIISPNK